MKEYSKKQNENINVVWFLMPLAFVIIWISRFFDYFFLSNILYQNVKLDNKTSLSKKINWIVFINYLFAIITWISFILFLVTPFTSFSYLPFSTSDLLLPIQMHIIYCFIFLVIFMLVSLAKAQIIKRLVIKLCIKEYSKNI